MKLSQKLKFKSQKHDLKSKDQEIIKARDAIIKK